MGWSIVKWAALAWIALGTTFWLFFSFGPSPENSWHNRLLGFPVAVIAWPWYLDIVTHSDPAPIKKLIFYAPIDMKPEIVTDLGVVRPPPPTLIELRKPSPKAPMIVIDERLQ